MSEPFHPNSAGAALMSDDIAHAFAEQLGVEYPDRYGDRVYDTGNITITNSPAPGTICAGRPDRTTPAPGPEPPVIPQGTPMRQPSIPSAPGNEPQIGPPSTTPPAPGGRRWSRFSRPPLRRSSRRWAAVGSGGHRHSRPRHPKGSPGSDRRQERPRVDPVRPVARGAADVVLPAPRAASLRNPGRRSCPPARDCCDAATGRSQAPRCLSRRLCRRLLERFLCMSTL
jgi:hypothetical protein